MLKNVNLLLWLPFNKLTNPAVVFVSDVTGTDWYVTSGRSTSIVCWRQLPFAAEALNYTQIIVNVRQLFRTNHLILKFMVKVFKLWLSVQQIYAGITW